VNGADKPSRDPVGGNAVYDKASTGGVNVTAIVITPRKGKQDEKMSASIHPSRFEDMTALWQNPKSVTRRSSAGAPFVSVTMTSTTRLGGRSSVTGAGTVTGRAGAVPSRPPVVAQAARRQRSGAVRAARRSGRHRGVMVRLF
jgi:hypothetical protein